MTPLVLVMLLGADAGQPPLPSAFSKVVFESAAVLEIEVPLDASLKATPRWAKGLDRAKPGRLVASRAVMDAPEKLEGLKKWDVLRSCLGLTNGRTSVKVLLVQSGNPPAWTIFPLATMGFAMESTPGYAQLVAAVTEAYGWHEERMRAVGADQLWSAERKALQSDNPYLRHLAAEFLLQHDAGAVVDEAWGAPGSEQRAKSEAASRIVPECQLEKK